MKQMKGRKTPRPDGFQACFLHKYWSIVGNNVISMVLGVLNNSDDINPFNDTNMSLIPKIKNPSQVKDYRPIGLYNIIYKLISKTILNMLKPHMNSIIHDSQSIFVDKRLITTNVIVAFEAFHSMIIRKINGYNHFALKLDLNRSFDRVEWNYLESIMLAMLFLLNLVSLILRCIRIIFFLCLLMDTLPLLLPPTRGICQGDLLSTTYSLYVQKGSL